MWGKTNSNLKQLKTSLFRSGPIVPAHQSPGDIASGNFSMFVTENDVFFFRDFDWFGRSMNRIDDWPWRLQEKADTLLRDAEDPAHGRRYDVFYNQVVVGLLEVSAGFKYTREKPEVWTTLELEHVRLLPFEEVCGFLVLLSQNVTGNEEQVKAGQAIDRAMIQSLWHIPDDDSDLSGLRLSLTGSAANYLRFRDLQVAR